MLRGNNQKLVGQITLNLSEIFQARGEIIENISSH